MLNLSETKRSSNTSSSWMWASRRWRIQWGWSTVHYRVSTRNRNATMSLLVFHHQAWSAVFVKMRCLRYRKSMSTQFYGKSVCAVSATTRLSTLYQGLNFLFFPIWRTSLVFSYIDVHGIILSKVHIWLFLVCMNNEIMCLNWKQVFLTFEE